MPSEEFMKTILESDAAKLARGEVLDPAGTPPDIGEEEDQEESAPDQEEQEQPGESEEEVAEEEGGVPERDAEDEEGEAEAQPEAVEEEFYLGRFKTREDAERGWEETYRFGQENARLRAEAEQRLAEVEAYYQGRDSMRGPGAQATEYQEWVDEALEQNPEGGMHEAIRLSVEQNDPSFGYEYADRWGESDPYRAATWRLRLEQALYEAQVNAASPQPNGDQHPSQPVINQVFEEVAAEFPDMRDPEIVRGMAELIRNDPEIMNAALTGEPTTVRLAFTQARERVRASRNGPRRAAKASAEAVARDKRGAQVVTGDGAPKRRSSYPVLTAEEESLLAGAAKLGLKRRDEE